MKNESKIASIRRKFFYYKYYVCIENILELLHVLHYINFSKASDIRNNYLFEKKPSFLFRIELLK